LSPNARTHWTRKAHCTQKYRWLVGQLARPLAREKRLRVPWDKATVSLTFYQPNDLRRDADNFLASMKAAFDGLVDAGILKDDNRITHLPVEMKLDRKNPRVEMLVTPRMG
jgi:crossover junction endodeoxyribonuclease RusA